MTHAIRNRKEHSLDKKSDPKETWNQRHTLKSGRQPLLCSFEELPAWYRDSENEYIRHGYRPELSSAAACLSSWTYIHNESFNIFSHLIAALSFLVGSFLMDRLIIWNFPAASTADRAVFAFFVSAGVGAFTLSSLYHTFICHSLHFSHLWLQLDFVGIVCLTFGGFVSGIYVGFYCDPALQKRYWSMVSPFAIPLVTSCRRNAFHSAKNFHRSRNRTILMGSLDLNPQRPLLHPRPPPPPPRPQVAHFPRHRLCLHRPVRLRTRQ